MPSIYDLLRRNYGRRGHRQWNTVKQYEDVGFRNLRETPGTQPGFAPELGEMGEVLDEFGFTKGGLPGRRIALQMQHFAEQRAAQRNAQLGRSALTELQSGLGNLQTYRPGGAAAMLSPYYTGRAQTLLAMRREAPDLLGNLHQHYEKKRTRLANRWATNQMITSLVGSVLGGGASVLSAHLGGGGAPSINPQIQLGGAQGMAGGAAAGQAPAQQPPYAAAPGFQPGAGTYAGGAGGFMGGAQAPPGGGQQPPVELPPPGEGGGGIGGGGGGFQPPQGGGGVGQQPIPPGFQVPPTGGAGGGGGIQPPVGGAGAPPMVPGGGGGYLGPSPAELSPMAAAHQAGDVVGMPNASLAAVAQFAEAYANPEDTFWVDEMIDNLRDLQWIDEMHKARMLYQEVDW